MTATADAPKVERSPSRAPRTSWVYSLFWLLVSGVGMYAQGANDRADQARELADLNATTTTVLVDSLLTSSRQTSDDSEFLSRLAGSARGPVSPRWCLQSGDWAFEFEHARRLYRLELSRQADKQELDNMITYAVLNGLGNDPRTKVGARAELEAIFANTPQR